MLLTSMKNSLIALLISFLSLSIWSENFEVFDENGNLLNRGITKEEVNIDSWYPGTADPEVWDLSLVEKEEICFGY